MANNASNGMAYKFNSPGYDYDAACGDEQKGLIAEFLMALVMWLVLKIAGEI